jgi:hypothetical protein
MLAPKFMNEILYNQKNFLKSQENFLSDLKPYMLVPEVWEKLCAQQPSIDVVIPNNIIKSTSFKPGLRDSVFWCIYVAIHGESCYQSHIKSGTNMINLMMNEKKAISDHFNNNSTLLKNSNQKLTLAKINEIKCNLMTKPVMDSVESFIPCSIYYGRPIYVYFEEIHSYLRFADKNYVSDNDNTDEDNDVSYNDPNVILIMVQLQNRRNSRNLQKGFWRRCGLKKTRILRKSFGKNIDHCKCKNIIYLLYIICQQEIRQKLR